MSECILIDTHAAIWLAEGTLGAEAQSQIWKAGLDQRCYVSPATAWEVGILARRNRYQFKPDTRTWLDDLLANPAIRETPLTSDILLASNQLPGVLHGDPADRMLIATARALDCTLMTRDTAILAYAEQGHVKAIAC